jgi:hypothetical protein
MTFDLTNSLEAIMLTISANKLKRIAAPTGLLAVMAVGLSACGSTSTTTISAAAERTQEPVTVVVTAPTSGSVIGSNSVIVRGTVVPASASVEIQGKPAAVGDGVFTGTATLHGGKTTIDVIGSAPNEVPGATSVTVIQQASGASSTPASPQATAQASPSATPAVAYEQSSEPAYARTSCGGDLSVGPDTTCAFAENVRSTYESQGPGTYAVYSPVTEKTYSMSCSYGTPVSCSGGNDATVYFP